MVSYIGTGNKLAGIRCVVAIGPEKPPRLFAASFRRLGRASAKGRSVSNPALEVGWLGFRLAVIPEPGTALLLGAGLVGLGFGGRRRRDA